MIGLGLERANTLDDRVQALSCLFIALLFVLVGLMQRAVVGVKTLVGLDKRVDAVFKVHDIERAHERSMESWIPSVEYSRSMQRDEIRHDLYVDCLRWPKIKKPGTAYLCRVVPCGCFLADQQK